MRSKKKCWNKLDKLKDSLLLLLKVNKSLMKISLDLVNSNLRNIFCISLNGKLASSAASIAQLARTYGC